MSNVFFVQRIKVSVVVSMTSQSLNVKWPKKCDKGQKNSLIDWRLSKRVFFCQTNSVGMIGVFFLTLNCNFFFVDDNWYNICFPSPYYLIKWLKINEKQIAAFLQLTHSSCCISIYTARDVLFSQKFTKWKSQWDDRNVW